MGTAGATAGQNQGGFNNWQSRTPSNPFVAKPADIATHDYGNALGTTEAAALGSLNAGAGNAGNQQWLMDQLRQQIMGGGPNLAQDQLQRALQMNTAGAASAIGSQRGINPALQARMILQQQGQLNQQAAQDSATARMQQQLAAQSMYGQQAGVARAQDIGQQQANFGAYGQTGGMQQGQSGLQIQNNQGTNAINAGTGNSNANLDLGAQQMNAQASGQNAGFNAGLVGGALGGLGAANAQGAQGGGAYGNWVNNDPNNFAKGGKVHAPVGQCMSCGGKMHSGYKGGGKVPGEAKVKGDSPKNDTVPAMVSPGEVVLPRSVANDPEKAAAFVKALEETKDPHNKMFDAAFQRALKARKGKS